MRRKGGATKKVKRKRKNRKGSEGKFSPSREEKDDKEEELVKEKGMNKNGRGSTRDVLWATNVFRTECG